MTVGRESRQLLFALKAAALPWRRRPARPPGHGRCSPAISSQPPPRQPEECASQPPPPLGGRCDHRDSWSDFPSEWFTWGGGSHHGPLQGRCTTTHIGFFQSQCRLKTSVQASPSPRRPHASQRRGPVQGPGRGPPERGRTSSAELRCRPGSVMRLRLPDRHRGRTKCVSKLLSLAIDLLMASKNVAFEL